MPQGIGVSPDLQLWSPGLGGQPDAPLVGAVAEVAHTVPDDFLELAIPRSRFGRTGHVHQVAEDAMGTLRLGQDGAERADGGRVGFPDHHLTWTT